MDEKAEIKIDVREGFSVIAFKAGTISSSESVTALSESVVEYIKKKRPELLVVDFEGVKFFSSQVLGVLLKMRAEMKKYGGEVVVSGIEPRLYRVFRITNLDSLFRFFP